MGLVYAEVELINAGDLELVRRGYFHKDQVRGITVNTLVDSGAYMLAINETIKLQLGLFKLDVQIAEMANGTQQLLEIVGSIEIRFQNRRSTVDAMVLPGNNEIWLGSIPMEDMDVLIDPKNQQLIINPVNPFVPKKSLK